MARGGAEQITRATHPPTRRTVFGILDGPVKHVGALPVAGRIGPEAEDGAYKQAREATRPAPVRRTEPIAD
jgi:hypothetical protein